MEKKLNETFIKELSKQKNEPKWMLDFRLKAYEKFLCLENPNFGPSLNIDFDKILYYKKTEEAKNDWQDVNEKTYHTFCKLGVVEAEEMYLIN